MIQTHCPTCSLSFIAGDVVVATIADPFADDGPSILWVHERCAPPSEREVEEE